MSPTSNDSGPVSVASYAPIEWDFARSCNSVSGIENSVKPQSKQTAIIGNMKT